MGSLPIAESDKTIEAARMIVLSENRIFQIDKGLVNGRLGRDQSIGLLGISEALTSSVHLLVSAFNCFGQLA